MGLEMGMGLGDAHFHPLFLRLLMSMQKDGGASGEPRIWGVRVDSENV